MISVLFLVTGGVVCCKVKREDDDYIYVTDPLHVNIAGIDKHNRLSIMLVPFIPGLLPGSIVKINKTNVISIVDGSSIDNTILSMYMKATSGLELPNKQESNFDKVIKLK